MKKASRNAFTLVELVASLAASSILLTGVTSTMFVALRASDPDSSPAAAMLTASNCLADMAAELQYAQSGTEATSTAVTVTVPDRSDADGASETIRYAWSGVAGQPLTRQLNAGAVVNVIPSVQSIALEYYPSLAAAEILTVRIQPSLSSRSVVETSFPLINQ